MWLYKGGEFNSLYLLWFVIPPLDIITKTVQFFLKTMKSFTLSKAIGRDSFSIGAEMEDEDVAFDGADALDIIELIDENDDCGRSVYKTSWLFADGKETAVVAMFFAVNTVAVDDNSTNDKFSLSLSGGTLDNVGSMACNALAPVEFYFGTNFTFLWASSSLVYCLFGCVIWQM